MPPKNFFNRIASTATSQLNFPIRGSFPQRFHLTQSKTLLSRSFLISSGPLMKDILQDLYIKEIKTYKPVAPEAPKIDDDISGDLSAYDVEEAQSEVVSADSSSLEKQLFGDYEEEITTPVSH
ncbi:141_t:CDS:2 [Entrophospora sp. SA101]|nr:141_t:CDS:2 [Entrophospora sp. SA101]CAJ0866888.1 15827_t:CDS:2 [Entrophospora sp. SA101]